MNDVNTWVWVSALIYVVLLAFAARALEWAWHQWEIKPLSRRTIRRMRAEAEAYMRDTTRFPTGSAVPSSVEPPAPGSDPSEPGAGPTLLPAAVDALTKPGGGQDPNSVGATPPDTAPTGTAVEATTAQPPRVASTAPTRSTAA